VGFIGLLNTVLFTTNSCLFSRQ